MRSKAVWALIALNALLLALLVGQWLRPNAAMAAAAEARPSDYILIPGTVQASQAQIIYMIDTQNGWLSARTVGNGNFSDMKPIDLKRIFQANAAAGAGTGNPRRGAGGAGRGEF